MDQPEPTQKTESHVAKGIQTTMGRRKEREDVPISKRLSLAAVRFLSGGAYGMTLRSVEGLSGNGLCIAEGEISGNPNQGELPLDPVSSVSVGVPGMAGHPAGFTGMEVSSLWCSLV